jgi:hypothetical protein
MKHRTPPKLATALLKLFGPRDPAFAGDLEEEFRSGKSSEWYWRQVVSVLWASLCREIRGHPVPCALCLLVGWFVRWQIGSTVVRFTIDAAYRSYSRWYFAHGGLPPPPIAPFTWILNFAIAFSAYALGGFTAVRCYGGRRSLIALMFAVVVACEQIAIVIWLSIAVDASTIPSHYVFQPMPPQNAALLFTLPPIAALIGGLFGSRRETTRVV